MTAADLHRLASAFRSCLDAPETELVSYAAIWKVAGRINRAFADVNDWNPAEFVDLIEQSCDHWDGGDSPT